MIGYIANHKGRGISPIQVRKSSANKQLLYSTRNRFLERGCRCGETNLQKLECHHTNPATKEYNIGELIFINCLPQILLAELEKCEPICQKCHAIRHPKERKCQNTP